MQERIRRLPRWQFAAFIGAQLLIVAAALFFNFRVAAARPSISLPLSGFASESGQVPVSAAESGGVLIGPASIDGEESERLLSAPFALPRGSYRLEVEYAAVGERCVLSVEGAQEADLVCLYSHRGQDAFTFVSPRDGSALRFSLYYASDSQLELRSATARPTADLANRGVLLLALAAGAFDLALWLLRRKTRAEIGVFCAVAAIGLFASLPFLQGYVTSGLDLRFHLTRIEALKEGLLAGQFPVRIQDLWYGGIGYPVSVMYGDLFLYFPALLRLLGVSLPWSLNLFRIALSLFTAAAAWTTFRRIFQSVPAGLLGAGLYTLCPYRITNLFNRAAIGEATATAFFPLVLLGLYLIYFDDAPRNRGWLWLTLGLSGLINSHVLSCEMAAGVMALWALFFLRRTFRRKTLSAFFKAGAATLGLNLWFLLPFADYSHLPFAVFSRPAASLEDSREFIAQIFQMFPNVTGSNMTAAAGTQNELNYSVGLALLIGLFALLYALYLYWGSDACDEERRVLRLSAAALGMSGILLAVLLGLVPLSPVQALFPLLAKAVSALQLLPRLLLPLSLTLTLAACCAVWLLWKKKAVGRQMLATAMCLCAVISASYYFDEALARVFAPLDVYGVGQLNVYENHLDEYLYTAANPATFRTIQTYSLDPGVQVKESVKEGLTTTVRCSSSAGEPGRVITPLFYYPYYRAEDAATGSPLPLGMGPDCYLQVELPAGFDGEFTVFFREPAHWRLAELISLACLAALLLAWRRPAVFTSLQLPKRKRAGQ